MSPALLFPIAILTPFLLTAVLLVPIYAGLLGGCYIVYLPETGAHPLAGKLLDIFYILDVYGKLFSYWSEHSGDVSFVAYTLPIIGLPVACTLVALYTNYRMVKWLGNIFHLSASVN